MLRSPAESRSHFAFFGDFTQTSLEILEKVNEIMIMITIK